jgi:hypothetical protein
MGASFTGGAFFRGTMKTLAGFLMLANCCVPAASAAPNCQCERTSPAAGFDRAQYVFEGKIIEAGTHTWRVEVDRIWKGKERLGHIARLMDVYAGIDCEFYFELGARYIFFAILAKGGGDVFYHPQVCNWTSPLRSKRVLTPQGESIWLEDLIEREHGPGEPPREKQSSMRLP